MKNKLEAGRMLPISEIKSTEGKQFVFEEYPAWICSECATSRGYSNRCMLSTFHEDLCGWCEQIKTVTQPRDYGYPKFSNNMCDNIRKDIS